MKKANIFILIALFIFLLGSQVLKPLSGKIYANQTLDPITGELKVQTYDPLSKFMWNFSKEITAKPISLEQIDHIVIDGPKKNTRFLQGSFSSQLNIQNTGGNNFYCRKNNFLVDIDHEIKDRTLFIHADNSNMFGMNVNLENKTLKSISINGMAMRLFYKEADSSQRAFETLYANKKSQLTLEPIYYREETQTIKNMNLSLSEESTFKFNNVIVKKIEAKLDNSMMDISEVERIDSLQADLKGLSHIRGTKKAKNNKAFVQVSGNLDYFNKHSEI